MAAGSGWVVCQTRSGNSSQECSSGCDGGQAGQLQNRPNWSHIVPPRVLPSAPLTPHLPPLHHLPLNSHPPAPPLQGDFLDQAAELIVKQWKEVKKSDVFYIDSKKKVPYWPDAAEEEAA